MLSARMALIAALGLALAACGSNPKPDTQVWTGGDAGRLAADKAQCRSEAANLDVNNPASYSDPRYGETSAMAEAVAKDNPLADRDAIVRRAAYETCMTDKGWRTAQ
jgi:hypothetical protein